MKKDCHFCKARLFLSVCFFFLASPPPLLAQSERKNDIHGIVSDSSGKALPQVTVSEKGTGNIVVTNAAGKFNIKVSGSESILSFSSIGFAPYDIKVGNQSIIDVSLMQISASLGEVVVVGYGTQNKNYVTTSIAKVKAEDFVKGVVTDPIQLIRGKVAGLAVNTNTGDPNGGVQIMLRGVNTLSGNQSPLIIIDGIPGGSLATISQDDIEV
ncbi:MAG: hypothetical protein HC867_05415 [Bacteroidia bacterium]|nr:hypothetical protein [Bacteroidia bacterium]